MIKSNSKPISFFVFASVLSVSFANAQESVNSSGGDFNGSGGSVAYSIGQPVFTAKAGVNENINEGVQQVYDISTVGVKQTNLDIVLSVFPNPTQEYLVIKINEYSDEKLSFQLCDLRGRILSKDQIVSKETQINMSQMANATYLVTIINQQNKNLQTFKIIKH